jgi:predicted metal-dependent hydrolase
MPQTIRLGDIAVAWTRKSIKHVHLSVHPPKGRITLVAPVGTRPEVARAFVASKIGWIRKQQAQLLAQARETTREYIERESHHLWGRRYLLSVRESKAKPSVQLDHRRIVLIMRPGSSRTKRDEVMQEWHRALLHEEIPGLVRKWEARLGVRVAGYFLQRMKTKWGGCNHRARNIRINTELVKKPKDLLEYVIVHEILHLLEPRHSDRFVSLLQQCYPTWREARAELNDLPLRAEKWCTE